MADDRGIEPENEDMQSVSGSYRFFGSYDHSIDAKGRIIIPNAYRKPLGETFTVTVDLDDSGIALYPQPAFDKMIEDLFKLPRRKPAVKRLQDHVSKYSYTGMQADSQGRVLLPGKLRAYALGDSHDVEIVGGNDHIRIVDSTRASDEDLYFKEHIDEILDEIASLDEE